MYIYICYKFLQLFYNSHGVKKIQMIQLSEKKITQTDIQENVLNVDIILSSGLLINKL